jgi:quinol monooxygenase YgiN
MADTLHIIATLRAKPGQEAALREILEGLIAPTRKEAGCLDYRLVENREDPAQFTFIEEWTNEAALEAHFETEHLVRGRERMGDLLAAELDLRKCRQVG